MKLPEILETMQRMIEKVPQSVVHEYKYFYLPSCFQVYDSKFKLEFMGYEFEYFNDELMKGGMYLNNHTFFFKD